MKRLDRINSLPIIIPEVDGAIFLLEEKTKFFCVQMTSKTFTKRIAILGGGPSGLFAFKYLLEADCKHEIHLIEAKSFLGPGMPYSRDGANHEHVTNVSDNEIPEIVTSIEEWVQTLPDNILADFGIEKERFNEYKVLPRLFFGMYLAAQFKLLLKKAEDAGFVTKVHLNTRVVDIADNPENQTVAVCVDQGQNMEFDHVIICTGHKWPLQHEGKCKGYFDSPYPPKKLRLTLNHAVAIKGSSLTAIDAIRTLSRNNGSFETSGDGRLQFIPSLDSPDFKIVMHSRSGLLPAIRFHLEEPLLSTDSLLTEEELLNHIQANDGFLSLDYIFEKDFKDQIKEKDRVFYDRIKDMNMEDFVETMMGYRESKDPFSLFRNEYIEAEKSIKRKESIQWKELLAVLSFALNYPAKYLSAEDMQRLQKVLMPLISIVIAFVPQSSAQELLALHEAGKLEIIAVGDESEVEPDSRGGVIYHYDNEEGEKQHQYYQTFIDCVGQPHLTYASFPFKSLVEKNAVSPARIKFKSNENGRLAWTANNEKVERGEDGAYYLKVSGITINDSFQVVDPKGAENNRIYIMAVPYIGGYNPDYSGLDFCEQASQTIVASILDAQS
jgi:hypothetical protein